MVLSRPMSSATRSDVGQSRQLIAGLPSGAIPDSEAASGPNNVLTPRQQELEFYWQHYRTTNYEGRATDWDGKPAVGHIETETIARGGVIPPGFVDVGGSMAPLKFRKPTAPSRLARTIVKRFTSLLFSQRRHPKIACDDPLTEDWLQGFAEATRLWNTMERVRNFGGAMGTTAMGFKFLKGKPIVEVHDPRHCYPEFEDRSLLTVASFEKRYQYPLQVQDPESGEYEEKWFWYRRMVDKNVDIIWAKVAVTDDEPDWEAERFDKVTHGFGFCPIVWIQNQFVDDDVDGDPDPYGAYDMIECVDALNSQANRGTLANCDPTLSVTSDLEFAELKKGSANAIQVEKGGALSYLEIAGTGIEKALELADRFEEQVCTMVRVTLDRNEGGPSRTIEEVATNQAAMYDQADTLRERYGEFGVKRLLEMVLEAVRKLQGHKVETDADGMSRIVREVVILPKKRASNPETGEIEWTPRVIGEGEQIELRWPDWITPSQDAVGKAVNAAGTAKTLGLIDQKHATEYVAEYFDIENSVVVIENIAREQAAAMGMPFQEEGGFEDDAAAQVAERTLAGDTNPIPDPTAAAMKKAGAFQ